MTEPFISHSEITGAIYIVCDTKKYNVTEQVIRAMRETGRLEQQRPHGEWIQDFTMDTSTICSKCGEKAWYKEYCGWVTKSKFCPNCGADMRVKEGDAE